MVTTTIATLGSSFQYFIQQRNVFLIPNIKTLTVLSLKTDSYMETFLWVIKANFNTIFIIIPAEIIFLAMETETIGMILEFPLLLFK